MIIQTSGRHRFGRITLQDLSLKAEKGTTPPRLSPSVRPHPRSPVPDPDPQPYTGPDFLSRVFLAPLTPVPERGRKKRKCNRFQDDRIDPYPMHTETREECTRCLDEAGLYMNYSRASTPEKGKRNGGEMPHPLDQRQSPTPPCQWLMQSLPNVPRPPLRSVSRNECISAWVSRVFFFLLTPTPFRSLSKDAKASFAAAHGLDRASSVPRAATSSTCAVAVAGRGRGVGPA